PNLFQRKRLRELVPRVLQETPKRVNWYSSASCAPHGRARHSCARRPPELRIDRRAEDCAPYPINGLPERRFRWLRLFATQNFDPATKPISFVGETVGTSDAFECPISLKYIEADAPLQLAQTNRTEMHRTAITFAQVIRAVHQTI